MSERRWLTFLALAMALTLLVPASIATGQAVKNPDTYVSVSIGDAETLDYAWAYDTASFGAIFNIYETLIFFDGGRIDRFVPMLATIRV